MCGIFGHISVGGKNSASVCLQGLKFLEYRGYDSAGISGIYKKKLKSFKHVGKVSSLQSLNLHLGIAIAHTRWATHGAITQANAHPHFDERKEFSIVHNGIIENYLDLKRELMNQGVVFQSETDTEVVVHLLAREYQGSLFDAMKRVTQKLRGAFALAAISSKEPESIVCAVRSAPLIIGICHETGDIYLSSDANAFSGMTLDVFYLLNDEIASLTPEKICVINKHGVELVKNLERLELKHTKLDKEGFEHYLLKEICEQPQSLMRALLGRIDEMNMTPIFSELTLEDHVFMDCDHITILGCGSAYHAGYIAKSMIEKMAGKHVSVEIASEFRYNQPLITEKTLVIAISQSGETADTIAAIELAQQKTSRIIAICNVMTSTIARMIKNTISLKAGPEISVCSTKAFTSQLLVLLLLAIKFGRTLALTKNEATSLFSQIHDMISGVEKLLEQKSEIEQMAKKTSHYDHTFFIGRQEMVPTCLEAALKLKEVSYVNALGIAAGELKHGTIALITPQSLTIALCGNERTEEKMESNMMEIISRNGPVFAFANEGCQSIQKLTENVIFLPKLSDQFSPFLYAVATQLYAYYVAKERGCDIDQPRNLAKSVTVE